MQNASLVNTWDGRHVLWHQGFLIKRTKDSVCKMRRPISVLLQKGWSITKKNEECKDPGKCTGYFPNDEHPKSRSKW